MLKYLKRFKSDSLIRSDLPSQALRVAQKEKYYYEIQEFQNNSLAQYFQQDALLFDPQTIIEKTEVKDFDFFLNQKNFFKVVDTLEKFEKGLLNADSSNARSFILFKKELYQMYQVRSRSIWEHEQYSFNIERENLKWLERSNFKFIQEKLDMRSIEHAADNSSLKGLVYKRKLLDPKRLKGLGAFAGTFGIYSYLPLLSAYIGTTASMFAACIAGVYGMYSFSDQMFVNTIEILNDKEVRITYNETPFSSKGLVVNIKDVQSVVSLSNDDLGEKDVESNIISIKNYYQESNAMTVKEPLLLKLGADAYRDPVYLDWLLANKDDETATTGEFNELMTQLHKSSSKGLSGMHLLTAKLQGSNSLTYDSIVGAQIKANDSKLDEGLAKLEQKFGKEYLEKLDESQLYELYKRQLSSQ